MRSECAIPPGLPSFGSQNPPPRRAFRPSTCVHDPPKYPKLSQNFSPPTIKIPENLDLPSNFSKIPKLSKILQSPKPSEIPDPLAVPKPIDYFYGVLALDSGSRLRCSGTTGGPEWGTPPDRPPCPQGAPPSPSLLPSFGVPGKSLIFLPSSNRPAT